MIDITDGTILKPYLIKRGLIASEERFHYEELSGGVSCKVVKVMTDSKRFVLKQARPQLQVKEEWFSDVRRILIERDCLLAYNEMIPGCVPSFIDSDDENYLIVMEAAPEEAENWKVQLLSGEIDEAIAKEVARAIAQVHVKGMGDARIHEMFKSTKYFEELRISPYLETIRDKYLQLESDIDAVIKMLLGRKLTLVHGDYSPKNILVANGDIYILDYEVAHIGHPGFDLGFLTNHLLLKAVKNKQWAHEYMDAMTAFIEKYFSINTLVNRKEIERETVQIVALLLLARVDGKSPAEYITDDVDKEWIRQFGIFIFKHARSYEEIRTLLLQRLPK